MVTAKISLTKDGTYCLNDPNRYTYHAVFKKSFAICFGFCTFMLPCRLELPHGHQVVALFQRVDTSEHYSHHPHITTSCKCSGHTSPPFALAPGYHSPQCGLDNFFWINFLLSGVFGFSFPEWQKWLNGWSSCHKSLRYEVTRRQGWIIFLFWWARGYKFFPLKTAFATPPKKPNSKQVISTFPGGWRVAASSRCFKSSA